MQAKRFIAADMRRALDMVKEEFGEDAMIMSTERTAKGVELVARVEDPLVGLSADPLSRHGSTSLPLSAQHAEQEQKIASAASRFQSMPTASSPAMEAYRSTPSSASVGQASGKTKDQLAEEMEMANRRMQAARKAESMTIQDYADQQDSNELRQEQRNDQRNEQRNDQRNDQRNEKYNEQKQEQKQEQKNTPLDRQRYADRDYDPQQNDARQELKNNLREEIRREMERDDEIQRLHEEISDMRNTLEIQMSSLVETQSRFYDESHIQASLDQENSYQQPSAVVSADARDIKMVGEIKQHLAFIGLTHACNDKLMNSVSNKKMPTQNKQVLWTHVLSELAKKIRCDTSDPIAKGGVYAFLGTTGVGKTTTIAKLAARYVMQHGPDDVVLLTTDNYRISSHNQLTSLGKILNVHVEVVEKLQDLPAVIDQYKDKGLVLIDTPGMGHSDLLLKPHLSLLKQCREVNNILVLSSTSQYQMMKSSLHSYRMVGLSHCVMTKLDECASLGDALSVMFEHDLPLSYMTDGQSVPKDLGILRASQWVSKALSVTKKQQKNSASVDHSTHHSYP